MADLLQDTHGGPDDLGSEAKLVLRWDEGGTPPRWVALGVVRDATLEEALKAARRAHPGGRDDPMLATKVGGGSSRIRRPRLAAPEPAERDVVLDEYDPPRVDPPPDPPPAGKAPATPPPEMRTATPRPASG